MNRVPPIQQAVTVRMGTQACRQGGVLLIPNQNAARRGGRPRRFRTPPRDPTHVFRAGSLYSRAKVTALTLPITGERQMEKHHRNREIFSFVGFGWSHSERQTFILAKIFVRTMLLVISFYLFIQMKIQSPHWKDSCCFPWPSPPTLAGKERKMSCLSDAGVRTALGTPSRAFPPSLCTEFTTTGIPRVKIHTHRQVCKPCFEINRGF